MYVVSTIQELEHLELENISRVSDTKFTPLAVPLTPSYSICPLNITVHCSVYTDIQTKADILIIIIISFFFYSNNLCLVNVWFNMISKINSLSEFYLVNKNYSDSLKQCERNRRNYDPGQPLQSRGDTPGAGIRTSRGK